MPQIANTNTLPEFANGFLLAGKLKTTTGGIATLYIKGDYGYTAYPSGLVIVAGLDTSVGGNIVNIIPSIELVAGVAMAGYTKITFQSIKVASGERENCTDVGEPFNYFIWVNDNPSKSNALSASETILLNV